MLLRNSGFASVLDSINASPRQKFQAPRTEAAMRYRERKKKAARKERIDTEMRAFEASFDWAGYQREVTQIILSVLQSNRSEIDHSLAEEIRAARYRQGLHRRSEKIDRRWEEVYGEDDTDQRDSC